jgi:phosphate transport system ATP-binding protein
MEQSLSANVKDLSFYYGDKEVVKQVSIPVYKNAVTALIGPSGCGKTTLLRCFNRMHDLYTGNRYKGEIWLYPENQNILHKEIDPIEVRMRIGMVFQKPNPFPKSIFENVAYGLRVRGVKRRSHIEKAVETALVDCVSHALWRLSPKSSYLTNRPALWTRSRPRISKSSRPS